MMKMCLTKTVSAKPFEPKATEGERCLKAQRSAEERTSTSSAMTVCFEAAFYL